jgi:hypothetical protein
VNLEPFSLNEHGRVMPLLRQGFPQMSAAAWQAGFERWRQADSLCTQHAGWVLNANGEDQGVMLTLRSERNWRGSSRTLVGLSSWFVRESARHLAVRMLRQIVRERDCVFVDTSPTDSVAKISRLLKMARIGTGTVRMNLGRTALHRDNVRLVPFQHFAGQLDDAVLARSLADHDRWGFLIIGVEVDGQTHPLVFERRRLRRIVPAFHLVYAQDLSVVHRARGSLSRRLLAEGGALLDVVDRGEMPTAPGYSRKQFGLNVASADYPDTGIDLLNTENSVFRFG